MTATVKLIVNSGSGVLAAVAARLQNAGLRVKSHNVEPINGSSVVLTLTADAAGSFDETELKTSLTGIEVVQSVEKIDTGQTTRRRERSVADVPDDLIGRLTDSFPRIMSHIQSYEERLANDPRKNDKLRQLGVESGRRLAASLSIGNPESISDVIDGVVLPAIGSIAEASRDGDTIVVPISLFTRRVVTSMDLFNGEGESCGFLCGLIEGLSASSPGFESVSVKETRCRASGDSSCVFSLT